MQVSCDLEFIRNQSRYEAVTLGDSLWWETGENLIRFIRCLGHQLQVGLCVSPLRENESWGFKTSLGYMPGEVGMDIFLLLFSQSPGASNWGIMS